MMGPINDEKEEHSRDENLKGAEFCGVLTEKRTDVGGGFASVCNEEGGGFVPDAEGDVLLPDLGEEVDPDMDNENLDWY